MPTYRYVNSFFIYIICFIYLFGYLSGDSRAHETANAEEKNAFLNLSFAPILKKARPAVVNIYGFTKKRSRRSTNLFLDDPFFQKFFNNYNSVKPVLGSGVIVRADGIVVTNHHVVNGSTSIKIVTVDGQEFGADIIYSNQRNDIAVLKIQSNKDNFATIAFADSDDLSVGDVVLAIGNPFGVGQSVSLGIVSALSRVSQIGKTYGSFIQTDAAINPGNSGGALINTKGQIIGINSAIYTRKFGSSGVGFAIPSNFVARILQDTYTNKTPKMPYIGAIFQNVEARFASILKLPVKQGVIVVSMHDNSPLKKAGLKVGDVITRINNTDIIDKKHLHFKFFTIGLGKEVKIKILRDKSYKNYSVILVTSVDAFASKEVKISDSGLFSGITIMSLSPMLAEKLELDYNKKGIVVTQVDKGSQAIHLGIKKGDIIKKINDKRIRNQDDFLEAIKQLRRFRIIIERKNVDYTIVYRG